MTAKTPKTPKTPKPAKSPPAPKAPDAKPAKASTGRPDSKLARVIAMLRTPQGATIEAISAETGWQSHSVRGAMSGAIKKKLGLTVVSEKTEAGRVYRITEGAPA